MERTTSDFRLYCRLLREARPYWRHIGTLLFVSLLSTPLALLAPVPVKIVVDSVVGSRPLPNFLGWLPSVLTGSDGGVLVVAAGLVVGIALLTQLQALTDDVLAAHTGEKVLLGFRAKLFRHVQRLSLLYHDVRGTSDSTYRIQYDAPAIRWVTVYGVTPFISAGLMLAGMIFVTATIDWQLAMVALAVSPLLLIITVASRSRLRAGWGSEKTLDSSAMSIVQEVLGGIRVVKAFGQEDREHDRFLERSGEGMQARIRLAFTEGVFAFLIGLTIAGGMATTLYIGAKHVEAGTLTLGGLLVVLAYLTQLYAPLRTIAAGVGTLQASLASAERAFFLLDQEPDVPERSHARHVQRASGAIVFDDVTFAYEAGHPVLQDVSFEVAAGTRVGIAGRTGSGKTTLINLLMRLYDPSGGRIQLDGVDVREYRLADLRNQFSVVLQESVLFSTTIEENIAYGKPGAAHEEIVAAARDAGAHDFVMSLPDGYDTLVGERGMRLSGGERQRLALARAFLRDAPILVCDEPTSAVDVRTEEAIMESMRRLMEGRTVFMVAHRLTTLSDCDAFLQLADGRIVSTERPEGQNAHDREVPLIAIEGGGGRPELDFELDELEVEVEVEVEAEQEIVDLERHTDPYQPASTKSEQQRREAEWWEKQLGTKPARSAGRPSR